MTTLSELSVPSFESSPPAARFRRPGWRDPRLAVGVGIVALCAVLGARLLGSADDTVAVWALRSDLAAGQELSAGDLETVRIRFGPGSDAARYLASDQPVPDGAVLTRAIGAGELLAQAALGTAEQVQLVQLTVSVPADVVPATLAEGATADIWVTREDAKRADLLLADVPVLSLPRPDDGLGPTTDRQVIVGLDRSQQAKLPDVLAGLANGSVAITTRGRR